MALRKKIRKDKTILKSIVQKADKQKAFLEVISTKNQNMSDNKKVTDIQKFIEKFEPSKFKMLSRGIEVRGIKDLNRNISFAKEVIEKLKLKLVISHSAEMAMYGSFEVNYL